MKNSCKGCYYGTHTGELWVCDYILMTGHRRPCPPGEGCTVRIEAAQDRKRAWKERNTMSKRTWDTGRARKLYDDGWSDARIAAELGTKPNAVAFWRRGLKLPANSERHPPPGPGAAPEGKPPQVLRVLNGPVSFTVELRGCSLTLRAPDLEGARWIHKYAGQLLEEIPVRLEKGVAP